MKNLIIGDTSQLSHYFPDDYIRIPSRNIDLEQFKDDEFNRVFITFAEQRTYIMDNEKMFNDVNVDETLRLVKFFKDRSKYVITYGSCELWNIVEGPINIDTPFYYDYSPYCNSKELMVEEIDELGVDNVLVMQTFNFNSPWRKPGFLFSKIFDSLINKTKIEIGDTYFYRDIIHPRYVVGRSINATKDELVGSGRLTFVNDFIRDLYEHMGMDYDDYVTENYDHNLKTKRKIFYSDYKEVQYPYQTLLNDTLNDLK